MRAPTKQIDQRNESVIFQSLIATDPLENDLIWLKSLSSYVKFETLLSRLGVFECL